jgi:rubrerythrin
MPGPGQNCVMLLIYFSNVKPGSSSIDNFKKAISGEDYEYESLYLEMIETAKAEKLKDAEMFFYYANKAEKIHSELFNKLYI